MKWVLLIFAAAIAIAIYTDNMGGAQDAASNYNKILRGSPQ